MKTRLLVCIIFLAACWLTGGCSTTPSAREAPVSYGPVEYPTGPHGYGIHGSPYLYRYYQRLEKGQQASQEAERRP